MRATDGEALLPSGRVYSMANVSAERGREGVMRAPAEILPEEIRQFLHAETLERREDSWASFLAQHNRLLLRVAYTVVPNREDAMDAYATLLEQLREDDGRRIRAYVADGRSKFTTWLVVVARRICVDFVRRKYGRYTPGNDAASALDRVSRRSLAQLIDGGRALAVVPDDNAAEPDASIRARELQTKLEEAVAELSSDDQLLLKLRYDDDLSASAIAKLVGSPTPFHVYRRLNALLAQLRARLAAHGVESAEP